MIDLVADLGMEALPHEYKTVQFAQIISSERDKIIASHELKKRIADSHLKPDRLFDLVFAATGDREAADKARAVYILETTREKKK